MLPKKTGNKVQLEPINLKKEQENLRYTVNLLKGNPRESPRSKKKILPKAGPILSKLKNMGAKTQKRAEKTKNFELDKQEFKARILHQQVELTRIMDEHFELDMEYTYIVRKTKPRHPEA